jgi:hypothetical protein
MIKFFRKIRQNLLSEGKTGKYLKYSIGEIVLVVIGILIALSINNWNQNRVNEQKEKLLLLELHDEFVKNQQQFESVVLVHKDALKSTNYMINQFPINPKEINLDTLFAYTRGWGDRYTFNPSQGVIKSLVNSSSFDIISDSELRKLLISWEDVLADYQEEENNASLSMRNHIGPKLLDNIPFGNFKDERFDTSYFASIQFENMFKVRRNNLKDIIGNEEGEIYVIRETISKIIELSKAENQ